MSRVYFDSNVFLYAIGGEHSYREPCRSLMGAVARGVIQAETSVETVQEIVHHRRRRGDPDATEHGRRAASLCTTVHAVDLDLVFASLGLVDRYPTLLARDAMHLATALSSSVPFFVSADRDFDAVKEVERIDPADSSTVVRLTGPG